jgi:response regulator RpfG family c-di-GMP phosphodiesterase
MRPILLVIDPPDVEMISTRKLILESAKYNVLTATTTKEALEIATEIPVSAMVIHERLCDGDAAAFAQKLKATRPSAPLWIISPQPHPIPGADRVLSSFDPLELVKLAQDSLGDPVDPKTGKTRIDPEKHPA